MTGPPPFTGANLQFELAYASNDGLKSRRHHNVLRQAWEVRDAISDIAYSVEWAKGHGVCDHNDFERKANILTSIPYMAVGLHSLRKRTTPAGRLYGASLIGVGAGSMTYHASTGRWRALGRKIDYWAIAIASAALVRASRPGTPKAATALSLVLTPFQPFAVVSTNGAVTEVDFLRRAQQFPHLRRAHRAHIVASALGGAAFIAEEFVPKVPLIHTAWHCCSAAGVAATGAFLADIEKAGALPR